LRLTQATPFSNATLTVDLSIRAERDVISADVLDTGGSP
jgi:hypothetical protein